MKRSFFAILFVFLSFLFAINVHAQSFSITNAIVDANTILLSWDNVTNKYIISQSTSLVTGQWEYVGWVLSTNNSIITNTYDNCFYKIRKVKVLGFSDPLFEQTVREEIAVKYYPTNQIYDIDVNTISNFSLGLGSSVSNITGMAEFKSLYFLQCWLANSLTNLDVSGCISLYQLSCGADSLICLNVSGCTNLYDLSCDYNFLTNINVSTCTNLNTLYCNYNSLTSLDVSNCINLNTLHCDNNPLTNLNLSANINLTYVDATSCLSLTNITVWWKTPTNIPVGVTLLYGGITTLSYPL